MRSSRLQRVPSARSRSSCEVSRDSLAASNTLCGRLQERSARCSRGSCRASRARGSAGGPHTELARGLREAVAEVWGKPLTMNVSMPIASVMLDLGLPSTAVKAVPILARTASLLAHLAEEQEDPIGLGLAAKAEEAVDYER